MAISHGDAPDSSSTRFASARRYPRHTADLRMTVQVFRPSGTISLWGRSSELGEDGVGGTLTGEIEPGEVVSMELAIPLTSSTIKVRALVRYRSGLHHGFEFLAMSPHQHEVLRRVCQMLAGED